MSDGKIQLEVVTPERRLLSQEVESVKAPGALGSFGVLPRHTAFVSQMKAGELSAVSGGQTLRFAVGEGFVQVANDRVLVLTESAERAEEIDVPAAQKALEAAQKKLADLRAGEVGYDAARLKVDEIAAKVTVATKK